MKTFRFIDFLVYQKSKILYREIIRITESLKYHSIKDQSMRAALSISLNIAEGSAKLSDKDFARFIQISLGSVNELFACIDIMKDSKLISLKDFEGLSKDCEEVAKQLGGLYKYLVNKN